MSVLTSHDTSQAMSVMSLLDELRLQREAKDPAPAPEGSLFSSSLLLSSLELSDAKVYEP